MRNNHSHTRLIPVILLSLFIGFPASAHKSIKHIKRNAPHSASRPMKLSAIKINNVQFAFNSTNVPSSSYSNLNKVAKLMADSSASLKLGGYADNKGGYVYNWKLSKKRADAVKMYLVSKGADSAKIASVEYGYTHPIASNKTATGREKNRRVEVHFNN